MIIKGIASSFHDTLKASDPKISFTIEVENNGQIAFLHTLFFFFEGMVFSSLMWIGRKECHTSKLLYTYLHTNVNDIVNNKAIGIKIA